jgi:undecaprenyl diphosphate synthase
MMDGNRRWAVEHHLPILMGHTEGGKNLKRILKAMLDREISFLTVWALSTENLANRSPEELAHLFSLFEKLVDQIEDLTKNNIRVNIIGDITKLPASTQEKLKAVAEKTKTNSKLTFNLAVNYGGRDELIRAVRKIIDAKIDSKDINEDTITSFLDTAHIPEPDLVIRTAGDQRLSGFLPWQSTYSELYFTPVKWPAFSEEDLDKAIVWFQQQKRNRGK